MPRFFVACLAVALPFLCLAADDSRPVCNSENQGRMWPDAANQNPRLISRLVRCGQLFICVRGTWHYHWESPSVRADQLVRHAKKQASSKSVCEMEAATNNAGSKHSQAAAKSE